MSAFEDDTEYSMILVMGVTGSGKSFFVNKLAERTVSEGPGLRSGTLQPNAYLTMNNF